MKKFIKSLTKREMVLIFTNILTICIFVTIFICMNSHSHTKEVTDTSKQVEENVTPNLTLSLKEQQEEFIQKIDPILKEYSSKDLRFEAYANDDIVVLKIKFTDFMFALQFLKNDYFTDKTVWDSLVDDFENVYNNVNGYKLANNYTFDLLLRVEDYDNEAIYTNKNGKITDLVSGRINY